MPTFDDVRSIAMALPEVEEKLTWETDVTFRIRDKIFVIGGEGSDGISMKASLDVQADLLDLDPETFSKAPYVGRYGWVNIKLDRIDRPLLEKLLRDAWRATAEEAARIGSRVSGAGEPAFTIRPATQEDEPALTELQRMSAIHHASIDPKRWRVPTPDESAASRKYWHTRQPRDQGLIAEVNGDLVGMVELWLRRPRDTSGARIPRIDADLGIVVAPDWRGQGVGTALLRAAEEWARGQGAERMILDLSSANSGALRLYERLGYEVHALQMDKGIEPGPGSGEDSAVIRNADGEIVPTLRGELVTIRPIRPTDRVALLEVLRDPTVVAVWDTRGPENSANELLAGDAHWTVWAIEVDGEFAGSIQAAENDDEDYKSAGIDIFMHSRFQGRGLGTDAVRTLARYLIQVRGHHRLTIDPAADNARAIRTYEKVGFRPVGVMRRYERGVSGMYHDGLLMDMLADELR